MYFNVHYNYGMDIFLSSIDFIYSEFYIINEINFKSNLQGIHP